MGIVILDHVFDWPHGGFLGVDVFFVISGFVITGIMLAEHDRSGRISFVGFYRRRIKRILPAATVVLVVTAVASKAILTTSLADQAVKDSLWSLFFAANWHFAGIGTDYFQSELPPSPVQHYWSLSVEEQFYIVWPCLLVLLVGLAAARGGRVARALPAAITALLVVASFAWALRATADSATAAYFSTFARAWQLLAGALLAMAAAALPRLHQQRAWSRLALGGAGLALVLGSAVAITSDRGIPAPLSAVAVVGALLVLAAGIGADDYRYIWPLSSRPARFLGDISFSLYLWHWPVVVLLINVMGERTLRYYAIAVVLTLGLSTVSYYLIEQPMHRSAWLEGRKGEGLAPEQRQRLKNAWLAVAAAVVVAFSFATVKHVGDGPAFAGETFSDLTSAAVGEGGDDAAGAVGTEDTSGAGQRLDSQLLTAIQTQLGESLDTDEFPQLLPSPDDFEALPAGFADWPDAGCAKDAKTPCEVGGGQAGTVLITGDSMAQKWIPAIDKAMEPYGYEVLNAQRKGCTIALLTTDRDDAAACTSYQQEVLDRIDAEKPDVVFMSDLYFAIGNLASGATGEAASAEWTAGLNETLDRVTASAGKVVIISAPPESNDPQKCITRFSTPDLCETKISAEWKQAHEAELAALAAHPGVVYIDTSPWVCTIDDEDCPGFVNGMTIRIDRFHVTDAFALYVAPLLVEDLIAAKVIKPAKSGKS